MGDFTIIHRKPRQLPVSVTQRPPLADRPSCEIIVAPWTFHSLLDQGFRLYLLNVPSTSRESTVALPESVFAPITEPPHFKLSQLTGSFAVVLTHQTSRDTISILLKPCPGLSHSAQSSESDSDAFHIYATWTSSQTPGTHEGEEQPETLPHAVPLSRALETYRLSQRASELCPGSLESGRCTVKTTLTDTSFRESPWVMFTSSRCIARGDIDTYSLEIRVRRKTEDELAEARTHDTPSETPPPQSQRESKPEERHGQPADAAGASNQVVSTDDAQPRAGREDVEEAEGTR
ncbi:hypothetical protein K466DRAFT_655151 [Polyporus arcularius HHB13444]|uniref:Uncharacterized protein n=1 Tax=Polyporus arcularius HHB13444 TaxID=1314778 RepID=A0A5C3PCH6_9APHY|nr:hypothetical protein K466DRAFT_655151 [Polyporus arcularius HHB13444]